jgi:hypothetical protein
MDKRKVNGGGEEDLDERASKRRKLPSVGDPAILCSGVANVCDEDCGLDVGDGPRRVLKRRAEGSWHCTTRRDSAFAQRRQG